MSSLISGASNPLLWQKVLSQSPNISYSTRGVSRVHDTDPGRKGDYWFRDFGMVMACAYMTELSFRIVDKFYTIPNLSDELQLYRLSDIQHPRKGGELYKDVQNYDRLPEVFQNRMMGSLVKGSSGLVPRIMREMADQDADIVDDHLKLETPEEKTAFSNALKALQKNPLYKESNEPLESAMRLAKVDRKIVQNISNIDNRDRREQKISKFLKENSTQGVNEIEFRKAVRLEDARQRGILIDHIQRNQNYKEYVTDKYFDAEHSLKSLVPDFLTSYGNKVYEATHQDQEALAKMLKETWHLPPDTRVSHFDKKFNEFKQHFFVREGQTFLTEGQLGEFVNLGEQFRKVLAHVKDASKDEWNQAQKALRDFQEDLAEKCQKSRTDKSTENTFSRILASEENLASEFRASLKKKLESTLDDIHRLIPGKNPHSEVTEAIKKLELHRFFHKEAAQTEHAQGLAHVQTLLNELKNALPERSEQSANLSQRGAINDAINKFMETLKDEKFETMVKPLLKKEGISLLNQNGDWTFLKKMERLVRDSMDSKLTNELISKVQKTSGWPKAFLTVAFNFVFYGLAASKFDNNILQPYQKKLVAERGTSQDIVNAGYLALAPGFAVLTQLFDKTTPIAAIRRLEGLTRFSLVGGAALATFGTSTYFILQQLLKNPPKNPPPRPAQNAPAASELAPRPFGPVGALPFASRPGGFGALPPMSPAPFALSGQSMGGFNRTAFPASSGFPPMKPVPMPVGVQPNGSQ